MLDDVDRVEGPPRPPALALGIEFGGSVKLQLVTSSASSYAAPGDFQNTGTDGLGASVTTSFAVRKPSAPKPPNATVPAASVFAACAGTAKSAATATAAVNNSARPFALRTLFHSMTVPPVGWSRASVRGQCPMPSLVPMPGITACEARFLSVPSVSCLLNPRLRNLLPHFRLFQPQIGTVGVRPPTCAFTP